MKRMIALFLLMGAAGYYYFTQIYLPAVIPGGVAQASTGQPSGQPEPGARRVGGPRNEAPVAVIATSARFADVPVTIDAIGTVQALNTVTVRAQVDGRLMKVAFKDGQDVKAGDILAIIDPTTYQAAYDQALAKKAQDQAQLANARIDLERYERLAKTEYGSRQQADTQRASVAQLEAQLRSDQGAIDNTKAILDYTTIRAPLDGRAGIRAVDQGNIVKASDPAGLVVITQLKPISIIFNLPQQQLRLVSEAMAEKPVAIQAFDSDNTTLLDEGSVSVIDNQVDQTTGTVRFKSEFPNARLQLWPGQFVNVKLLVRTLKQVVVVPTSAVQRGPSGTYVYIVGETNRVTLKNVTVSQQNETQSVITSGIEPPMRVVTTGFTRLTDGALVNVTAQSGEASPPVAAPANPDQARQRRSRDGNGNGARQGRNGGARDAQAGADTPALSGAGAPLAAQASPTAQDRAK